MKFIFDNEEITSLFVRLCNRYSNYEWAVAWAGEIKGFDLASILSSNEGKIKKIVVGLHFYQTSPSFIKRYRENNHVRFIMQSDGTFHSKVYLFYNSSEDWAAIIGSMNFTTSAFHHNSEAGVYITSNNTPQAEFVKIRDYIASIWNMGKSFSQKELEVYLDAFQHQEKKIVSLAKVETFNDKMVTSTLDIMTWKEYYQAVWNNESEEIVTQRVLLLEEANALFKKYKHFADMPENIRQCLAGVEKTMKSNSLVRDWRWFGSMTSNYTFYGEVNKGKDIGKAIDSIPLEGLVSEIQFNQYCDFFYKKWKNPLGCATRLLAIKRPDLFVCLDSNNRAELTRMLNIPKTDFTLEKYWSVILRRLHASTWYNDEYPVTDMEGMVKKYRVAMLDAICYRHNGEEDNIESLMSVCEGNDLAHENKACSYWLIPFNEKKFRFIDWLKNHDYVYWKQSVRLKPGDTVYIYGSAPIRAIVCALVVDSIDYPAYPNEEERQYWASPTSLTLGNRYAKLNVLALPQSRSALSFDNLHEHGLNVAPQKGVKLSGELLDYITQNF